MNASEIAFQDPLKRCYEIQSRISLAAALEPKFVKNVLVIIPEVANVLQSLRTL